MAETSDEEWEGVFHDPDVADLRSVRWGSIHLLV
jgi:hypothetical protein